LKPAARPTAQIHDTLTRAQQPMRLLDFGELVDRSRPKAFALGTLVKVVLAVVAGNRISAAA
jgi:hypothetical protein